MAFQGNAVVVDKVHLKETGASPPAVGDMTLSGGTIMMRDSLGVFDPRTGISPLPLLLLTVAGTLVYVGDADMLQKT